MKNNNNINPYIQNHILVKFDLFLPITYTILSIFLDRSSHTYLHYSKWPLSKTALSLSYSIYFVLEFFSKHVVLQTCLIVLQEKEFSGRGLNIDDYNVGTNVTTKSFSSIMMKVIDRSMNTKKKAIASSHQKPFLMLIDTEGYECDIVLGISPDSKY